MPQDFDTEAIDPIEAKSLPREQIKQGLKVKGAVAPFGGSWRYEPGADELTLLEPPTKDA